MKIFNMQFLLRKDGKKVIFCIKCDICDEYLHTDIMPIFFIVKLKGLSYIFTKRLTILNIPEINQ
jgi:hypothetical protein